MGIIEIEMKEIRIKKWRIETIVWEINIQWILHITRCNGC